MTSIEWLVNQIKELDKKGYSLQLSKLDEWAKEAKEMHKKEIMDAFDEGNPNGFLLKTGEQYYNETFNQQ